MGPACSWRDHTVVRPARAQRPIEIGAAAIGVAVLKEKREAPVGETCGERMTPSVFAVNDCMTISAEVVAQRRGHGVEEDKSAIDV